MNTHEGYSKKTISNANVLLAGGGDKSLGNFLSGIQYVSASQKIQYKTAADNASWLNLVTLVTTDENVKQVDNNNNLNSPILIKNGTGTGTITSSVLYADGVTINPSNNSITAGILFSTSYIQASTYIKASTYMEATDGFKKGSIGNSHVLLAGGGDADIEDFLSNGRIIVHPHNNDINSLYSVRFNGVKYTNKVRGHNCFVFNKGDLAFVQYTGYDTYGSEDATNLLATYLNNLVDKIVVIVSYDACRINSNLRAALKNLGGFQVGTFSAARYCHYFIGMTNCPEGRGYEDYGYSTYFSAKVECLIYLNKGIALNPVKIYSVNKVFNAYNADNVDWSGLSNIPSTFTPSSHTHNINDIKWPQGHNLIATATSNNPEWSIDLTPGTYTGGLWHVYRATTKGINVSGTLLSVSCDDGKVRAPYGFVGALTGNASTASKWNAAITLSLTGSVTGSASIDGSGNVSLATTTNHNHDGRYMRTYGTVGSGNSLFDVDVDPGYEGTITYDPVATNMAAKIESNSNVTALNLGNAFGRRKLLLFMYNNDNIYYRRHVYVNATNITWSAAVKLLHTGNTYVSNNKGYIDSVEITKVNNSDTSDWTKLLKPIASTTTASASTWNIPSGCKQVWGERFSDSTLKYTPSGGSATTITDTGDWTIWLAPNATSNAATLNMRIDGTYYGSFSGNLSGNASTASKWASSITLSLTGSVTGSASIDGSGNVSLATTTNHTHSNIVSLGNKSASDLSSTYPTGLSNHGIYNNNYPFSYGCGITSRGNGGAFQIAGQWNSNVTGDDNCDFPTEMYIRGRRDSYDVWTTWTRVLTNRNWTSVISLNNASLTLQTAGTTLTTFYANDSTNRTFNVTCANIGAATSGHNHDGTYVKDRGGYVIGKIYDIPCKTIFSGLSGSSYLTDGPSLSNGAWMSGLVLGSNWNNNHYQHYLVESEDRWYTTRAYASSAMKDWNTFAYLSDIPGTVSTTAAGIVPKTTANTMLYANASGTATWGKPTIFTIAFGGNIHDGDGDDFNVSYRDKFTLYAGTCIEVSNDGDVNIYHATSGVTAGTAGTSSATSGSTISIPYITVDSYGHVTGKGTHTHTVTGFATTNTTYDVATYNTLGLVKPWYSHTVASTGPSTGSNNTAITVNDISTTSGRYYAIEMDSNGRMFVNVPWSSGSDGDTKYYLTLNGTNKGHTSGTSLGSFYAPTSAGTSGQYLKSNGSGAPTWATFNFASSGHSHTLKIETTSDNSSIDLAASTKYKLTAGGSTYVFKTPAGGSTGSDVNVKQVYTSTSVSRPLLMKYGNTSSTSDVTNNVYYDTGVYANPYNHSLTATSFNGTLYGSATNLRSRGDVTCETSTTRPAVDGLSMSQAYSNGYPYDYGNIITCKGTGDNELLLCWSGTSGAHASAYIRSRRDVSSAAWSDWAEIVTSANYTNYLTTSGGTSVYQYHNQSMSSNTNYRILTSTRTSNGTLENVYSKSACYMNDNGVYFTSDKKMKKDIRMFSLETNIMDCYNPVRRFSWKSNDMPSIGFISQEVEEWCPEAVGISDDGLKTVNYDVALSALCGAMFNRIKELEQTVKELQYQININKR